MVSDTGNGIEQVRVSRSARVEHIGQAALVLSILALSGAALPSTRELAWIIAVPAVVLAVVSLYAGFGRKRYATAALLLGWFAFAYSFAMMLWG